MKQRHELLDARSEAAGQIKQCADPPQGRGVDAGGLARGLEMAEDEVQLAGRPVQRPP
jgi:hypothetical protein